ncbi:Putative phosphoserine phosphatase 2 [Pseudomonas sp. THAF187a]|uniref:histidine phosphatase family protein n=1 Tax=Pseudomonadaceae TaxID=135621 RepID=UPI0005698E28|nr:MULTISPECIES: histidine phosphatase family protein [Pseudomonas]QFT22062.1 Putative phosphoserine phosphatase 2 [Pseudomonas sp. THAF187a]QFT42249.1 Putative phosphoserine phosphatase 2 [Pseudomonas sp. THAF42]TNF09610.1 MAG: histidine phosphatase family protein [Pseudomonadales bacterium]
MGSIYLIRHGQASFGADDYDVLSPVGVRQAEVLGEHLEQLGIAFDRCVSGSLRRQQHTATSALQRMSSAPALDIDDAFNEFDADAVIRSLLPDLLPEEPEALHILRNGAQNRAEFQRLFAKLIQRWVSGEHDTPELQSWQAYVEQVAGGLQRILEQAHSKQNIAIFTSGGTITALLRLITGVPAEKAFELNWQIVNTSLSLLKFRGSEVSLASFNSHVHLQLLKAPELITYR